MKVKYIQIICGLLLVLRFFLLQFIPLLDHTESRYGEVARLMAETNNYAVPQIDYGVDFWAKPPLSTWLSAIGVEIFGETEFAVRLSSFILGILILLICFKGFQFSKKQRWILIALILTIPEFYLHLGVVSTDMSLLLAVTLVIVSFYNIMFYESHKIWGYLFFVGLGLGMLAKGPIIFILTMPAIVVWWFFSKTKFIEIKKFPLVLGSILTILIALPWYIIAEKQSPGFIDYFIIGEHFQRFFNPDWVGDKYGEPHVQPFAIIWVFFVAFFLPYSILFILKLVKQFRTIFENKETLFLLTMIIWPLFFFTFSTSLIHTYTLPVVVPFAVLLVKLLPDLKIIKTYFKVSLILPITAVIGILVFTFKPELKDTFRTEKYLVEHINHQNIPIYHFYLKTFSGQFYTKGKLKKIVADDIDVLINKSKSGKEFYLIITKYDREAYPQIFSDKNFEELNSNRKKLLFHFNKN
ncbi:ArnT family glycosyltransferase [Winogradskyella litorisediminis]|uniref:ArnT family glycosyltransferase n=1 Tax=Winogradskyella litorisediminis TaxID=1156618 RepID=A0ABW3N850_9FLAO